jgi:hypothetical protein
MRCKHSPGGGIHWLQVKPWLVVLRGDAPRIAPPPHLRGPCIICLLDFFVVVGHNYKLKTML